MFYTSIAIPVDSIDPDEEEFEVTENKGTTVDIQYNWAALLLWPVRQWTAVDALDTMVRASEQDVKNNEKGAGLIMVTKDMREIHKAHMVAHLLNFCNHYCYRLLLDNKELIVECLYIVVKVASSYGGTVKNDSFCGVVSTIANQACIT